MVNKYWRYPYVSNRIREMMFKAFICVVRYKVKWNKNKDFV